MGNLEGCSSEVNTAKSKHVLTARSQEVTHIGARFNRLQTQLEHKFAQQAKTKARTRYPLLQGEQNHTRAIPTTYSRLQQTHQKKKTHSKQKPSQKAALSLI